MRSSTSVYIPLRLNLSSICLPLFRFLHVQLLQEAYIFLRLNSNSFEFIQHPFFGFFFIYALFGFSCLYFYRCKFFPPFFLSFSILFFLMLLSSILFYFFDTDGIFIFVLFSFSIFISLKGFIILLLC